MDRTFASLSDSAAGGPWRMQGLRLIESFQAHTPRVLRLIGVASCVAACLLGAAATLHVARSAGMPLSYTWLSANAHDTHWARPWAGYLGALLLLGTFLERWFQAGLVALLVGLACAAMTDHNPAALVFLALAWIASGGLRQRFGRPRAWPAPRGRRIPSQRHRPHGTVPAGPWRAEPANGTWAPSHRRAAASGPARPSLLRGPIDAIQRALLPAVAQEEGEASAPRYGAQAQQPPRFAAKHVGAESGFAAIDGISDLKRALLDAGKACLETGPTARNGILLHGAPGNGKTVLAQALAAELRLPIISVSVADLVSRWVGEAPQSLAEVFRCAQAQAPCVLFIDECESILARRDGASLIRDEVNLTNVFLTGSVQLRGQGVVLVAATNFVDRIDAAALREGRFDFKLRVQAPDEAARLGILRAAVLGAAGPVRPTGGGASAWPVSEPLLRSLAQRWGGFSAARLQAVGRLAGQRAAERTGSGARGLSYPELLGCLREVQGRADVPAPSDDAGAVSDRASAARRELQQLARLMRNPLEFESAGGRLPRTLLVRGPKGSGKTTAVRGLAAASGWALFEVSTPAVLRDPSMLQSVLDQALQDRPAVVFLDDAQAMLMQSGADHTGVPAVVSVLRHALDRIDTDARDLVVAAAVTDTGPRSSGDVTGVAFQQVVELGGLDDAAAAALALAWLRERGWRIDGTAGELGSALAGRTAGEVVGALQREVNRALVESGGAGHRELRVASLAAPVSGV